MIHTNNIKQLQRTCGTYAIAKYLKSQGYPLYMALKLLTVKKG
jgi:hypothetical protein